MTTKQGDAYRATTLVFGANVFSRFIQFAGSIVVARLLVPNELGRFVLAVAILGVFEITAQSGLVEALVQSRDRDDRDWQAVWSFLVMRGVLISGLLFVLAGPIAQLFKAPTITELLQAVAFIPALNSLRSLALAKAQREVNFLPLVGLGLTAQVVNTATSVIAVAVTRSAWGLMVAFLASTTVQLVGSYLVRGFRPGFVFSLTAIRDLFKFGRWRFLSFALWWSSTQADDLIVGRALGTGPLALYRVAFRMAQTPTTEVTDVAFQVVFPAMARSHRLSPPRAHLIFHRYLMVTAGVSGLIAALLGATAGPLVHVLLGQAYAGAAVPLTIMAAAGFLRAVTATGGALFEGVGRPSYDTAMQALRACALIGSLLVLVRFGVNGAAVAALCSVTAMAPAFLYGLARLGLSPVDVAWNIGARIPAAAMAGVVAAVVARGISPPFVALLGGLACGLLTWVVAAFLLDRDLLRELAQTGRQLLRRAARGPKAARHDVLPAAASNHEGLA